MPRRSLPHPLLRKSLGQHHLVDGGLCQPLLDFLAVRDERVIEIGPGGGALTWQLLAAGARLAALELDADWAFELRRRASERGLALALAIADALELDWAALGSPARVTGNLPYNVGTVILERLLPHHRTVPRAAFLLQKEVALRMVAPPGSEHYGALSVLVQARARARILGRLKPGAFRPPPKVDSAFVGLLLQPPPLPEEEMPGFTATVKLAFGQRRKTLRNALGAGWGKEAAEATLAAAGLDPGARAEELGLGEFVALASARLKGSGSPALALVGSERPQG